MISLKKMIYNIYRHEYKNTKTYRNKLHYISMVGGTQAILTIC